MGSTRVGRCHSWNLVVPETQSVLSDQEMFRLFSLVDPSLSVIVMELVCTCILELLSLPVDLSK